MQVSSDRYRVCTKAGMRVLKLRRTDEGSRYKEDGVERFVWLLTQKM